MLSSTSDPTSPSLSRSSSDTPIDLTTSMTAKDDALSGSSSGSSDGRDEFVSSVNNPITQKLIDSDDESSSSESESDSEPDEKSDSQYDEPFSINTEDVDHDILPSILSNEEGEEAMVTSTNVATFASSSTPTSLSPDLRSLVEAGVLTLDQAVQMMSPALTPPDLEKMVEAGEITLEGAARLTTTIANVKKGKADTEEKNPLLSQCWATRQEAVDALKLHSTQQGKQVLVNRRESSAHRIVLECASKLSSTRDENSGKVCVCNYRAVIRKSKKKFMEKPYRLKQGTTVEALQHSRRCTAKGRLTFREAKMNLKTLKYNRVIPTIKKTHERIARDNKVPKSFISPYVAARTRLEEAKQANRDYFANWSKLDKWAEELTGKNPGSICHVDVDSEGRFKRMFVGLGSAAWVAANTGMSVV